MFWVGEGIQMGWQRTFIFAEICALLFPGYTQSIPLGFAGKIRQVLMDLCTKIVG